MDVFAKSFAGDRDALCAAIYQAKRASVLAIARSMAGHYGLQSLAEDITQIDFLRFHQVLLRGGFSDLSLSNWTEPNQHLHLQAWFFVTTLRVVQEFGRQNRRKPVLVFDDEIEDHTPVSTDLTPFQKLLLEEARQRCSPLELEILDLRSDGLTSREIGNRKGMNAATVRGHQFNARQRMQAYLDADNGDVPSPGLR